MRNIFERLESYQIITSLLPGIFFGIALKIILGLTTVFQSKVEELAICYFIGLVISRIGSLVVKPILKKIKFIDEAPYPEYVKAVKKDSKIDVLSETNNFFRNLLTGVILLIAIFLCKNVDMIWGWFSFNWKWLLLMCLLFLFLFALRKQTKYVRERVETVNNQERVENREK